MSTRRARPPAVDAAAGTRAARLLGWPGVVLAPMRLFGMRVWPVVALDADTHRARQAAGDGPQLDADVLAVWEWPAEFVARVFAVMAATPQHTTYQVLTKRATRLRRLAPDLPLAAQRVDGRIGGERRRRRARGRAAAGARRGAVPVL